VQQQGVGQRGVGHGRRGWNVIVPVALAAPLVEEERLENDACKARIEESFRGDVPSRAQIRIHNPTIAVASGDVAGSATRSRRQRRKIGREDRTDEGGFREPVACARLRGASMAQGSITDKDIAELVQRSAEANSALMRGDINGYLRLVKHAEDYTLMAPFGGA